jgi:UPF0755 protein
VLLVVVALSSAFVFRYSIRNFVEEVSGAEYSGTGGSEVEISIKIGDVGTDVARKLVDADVTKSLEITLRTIYARNPTFFPGTYLLPSKISSSSAIDLLVDPNNASVNRITIREGLRNTKVFSQLSASTGLPVMDFQNAAQNLKDYDIPSAAPSLEGYLYPATYTFDSSYSAKDILSILVERTKEQLRADGVSEENWHKVLTLASVIQREARIEEDFYRVSRVFLNRIKVGMPLQSDATVSYGVNGNTFQTSVKDRADTNFYNTYVHPGLPIGPISGVGALAIDAALNPAEGEWLYFVSVNLQTGETVFSNTYEEHLQAVKIWRNWLRENPNWND